MTTDIDLRNGDSLFRYRVAAVCLDRERVLLQQIQGTNYWFLPGGHGQLMETSKDSLRRELREELEVEAEVGRLLWVAENFFHLDGTDFHELGLYYLVRFTPGTPLLERGEFAGMDNEIPVLNRWQALATLDGIRLVPAFLAARLRHLPDATEAIVHRDHSLDS